MNRLLLLLTALLFSTGGAAIKLSSLTGWQIAGYRGGIAALVVWLALPNARRNWTWRTLLTGAAYAAMVVLFVLANKMTTSANAILLQSTYPLYLLLLSPLLLRERLHRVDLVVVAAVLLGAAILSSGANPALATAPDPAAGNAIAALSGLAWALTIACLRWNAKTEGAQDSAGATVIAGNLIAFAICLPPAFTGNAIHARDAGVIAWLGVFQVGLAYILLTRSLRHVKAFEAATLLMAEPVLNPLWSWLIHGERPGGATLTGGSLILIAGLGGTWWRGKPAFVPSL